MAGKFITFEGGEGVGKSTQVKRLTARLSGAGQAVIVTREPGGTPSAEAIREFVLAGLAVELGPRGEALLMAMARTDHVAKIIRPALGNGQWVICDRFIDSTRVYQGGPGGADVAYLDALDGLAIGGTRPDLTIILDLPVTTALARLSARHAGARVAADRFERDGAAQHEARRQAYLEIATREPDRCVMIDATPSEDQVAAAVFDAVAARLLAAVA
jgi:dTMP kinase